MRAPGFEPLRVFYAVAEARSFTAAAARLGLDKSNVSRIVRALEHEVGSALLVRTTRSVRLTTEGEGLFQRIAAPIAALEQAVAAIPERDAVPTGVVALTTTPDLARAVVAPALVGFRARYPGIAIRLVVAGEVVDLARDRVDLALRVGDPGTKSLVARKVGEVEVAMYAAPSYLERRGAPASPTALGGHDGLWPVPPRGQRTFYRAPPDPAVECADFAVLAELARAGAGVALLPTFVAARDVASGALVRVARDVVFSSAPIYLVSRPERPLPRRVALLRDHLIDTLAPRPRRGERPRSR